MKNIYLAKGLMLCAMFALASPSFADAKTGNTAAETIHEVRAAQLQSRLDEIKQIDKRTLSTSEKKTLRREVKEIKKELAAMSGGIYLSVGAIILIALLLILLL